MSIYRENIITGHTYIMLSPIVYPKSHLTTSDSLRHTAAAIESVCQWDMDQYCGVNTSISIS